MILIYAYNLSTYIYFNSLGNSMLEDKLKLYLPMKNNKKLTYPNIYASQDFNRKYTKDDEIAEELTFNKLLKL